MKHILYTEDEGGAFKYYALHSDKETVALFHKIIAERRFEYRMGDKVIRIVPAYVTLLDDVDGFDFVINKHRIGTGLIDCTCDVKNPEHAKA